MLLVDSHCHLNLLDLTPDQGDLNKVIARAEAAGVRYLLNVCVSLADFPVLLSTAEAYSSVGVSVGSHPNEQNEIVDAPLLVSLAKHKKVVAIGETGLDYFRTTDQLDLQQERFRAHIRAAKQIKKPLIIHTREAKEDTLKIMQEENAHEVGGVMHCFTEDWEAAQRALDMNFYISFSGVVTFKNATTIQEVAKKVPLERMLIETDSPYLAPIPYRGKPNEPAYVRHTAEYIAGLRNISLDTFAKLTSENFFRLFNGADRPNV